MRPLRIGTRGSRLALRQAEEVREALQRNGVEAELIAIKTTGDRRRDVSLAAIGGKGVFIKEIEEALERGEVDLAVHSLKDIPSITSPRFLLGAFLPRQDPRDAWIHPGHVPIENLHAGAAVATSSPRRRAQIRLRYPHLTIREIRGNVDTRLAKVRDGEFDGAVLATAGLHRLGREAEITRPFAVSEMVPAAGQGVIAVEISTDRPELGQILSAINDDKTESEARAERSVLEAFGTLLDCHSAIGVHAQLERGIMTIHAFLSDLDATRAIRVKRSGTYMQQLTAEVAGEMLRQGAVELLERSRPSRPPQAQA